MSATSQKSIVPATEKLKEVAKRASKAPFHWLQLPDDLKSEVMARVDQGIDLEGFAVELGTDPAVITKWVDESQQVKDLASRIAASRKACKITNSKQFKGEVLELVSKVGASKACKALRLNLSTVSLWLKQDKPVASELNLEAESSNSEEKLTNNIEGSETAKLLKHALSRHKGKVRRVYSNSEKRQIMEMVDQFGTSEVVAHFGISFDTIARWKRRSKDNFERKRTTPLRYIPVVDLMRKHPGMGPMQMRDYLRRHKGLSMSVASIRRVMEENGWVPPYQRITKLSGDVERYEAARKNYMWHVDFKHHWINKAKGYFMFVQDDYSRFIVGHTIVDGEKVEHALECLNRAISIQGKPETLMTDGGSAFVSWRGSSQFTRFLEDFGIEQIVAKTPNVNGKLENLHAQFEKEVLIPTQFSSLQHCAEEVAKWVGFYNYLRPHQGLGGTQVPADRYCPGAKHWFQSQLSDASYSEMLDVLRVLTRNILEEKVRR